MAGFLFLANPVRRIVSRDGRHFCKYVQNLWLLGPRPLPAAARTLSPRKAARMDTTHPARTSICNAMLDLMETQQFETISITDLTKKAGVSRTSFYRYFDSVYDVLQAIEDDYDEQFPHELAAVQDLDEMTHAGSADGAGAGDGRKEPAELEYAEVVARNFRTYRILTSPNGDPSFEPHMRNRVKRIMLQSLEAQLGPGLETDMAATFITGTRMYLMRWWAQHEREVDPVEYSRLCSELTMSTLKAVVDTCQRTTTDIRVRSDSGAGDA